MSYCHMCAATGTTQVQIVSDVLFFTSICQTRSLAVAKKLPVREFGARIKNLSLITE